MLQKRPADSKDEKNIVSKKQVEKDPEPQIKPKVQKIEEKLTESPKKNCLTNFFQKLPVGQQSTPAKIQP